MEVTPWAAMLTSHLCAHLLPRSLCSRRSPWWVSSPFREQARCTVDSGFCSGCSLSLGILFSLVFSRIFLRNHLIHEASHVKSQLPPTHTHALFRSLYLSLYFLLNVYYLTNSILFALFRLHLLLPYLESKMLEGQGFAGIVYSVPRTVPGTQ